MAGRPLKHLVGHLDRVYHASFSPDGRWVLTASRDGTARLWDSEDRGDVLSAIVELRGNGSGISSAAFSPDGRYVATGYWDPGADLWDALSGTPFVDMSLTIGDYAERFGLLNRLDQWRVQSVPGELPWWQELALAIWGRLH
jgi:WD40 repeat protein